MKKFFFVFAAVILTMTAFLTSCKQNGTATATTTLQNPSGGTDSTTLKETISDTASDIAEKTSDMLDNASDTVERASERLHDMSEAMPDAMN